MRTAPGFTSGENKAENEKGPSQSHGVFPGPAQLLGTPHAGLPLYDVSLKLCASGRVIRRGQKSTDMGSRVALSDGDAN